jgi:hypothetical protein
MLSRLKAKINRMNGWRRAWLVISVLGFVFAITIAPLNVHAPYERAAYDEKWAVEKNLDNPDCLQYSLQPFEKLVEPPWAGLNDPKSCYRLYAYRKHNNQVSFPYTKQQLDKDFAIKIWSDLGLIALIYGVIAILLSALVYFAGFLVAWVLAGFRRGSKE